MTPQEQQMIDGLISRVRTTQVQDKDAQADQHIQAGLSGSPDALYVLVQTVLVQQYGLDQAQSQINELKQQIGALQTQAQQAGEQKSSSGSFLSHIFGGGSNSQPQQPPQQTPYQPVNNPGYGQGSYPGGGYPPPPPAYPTQNYPPQNYPSQGYPPQGGGGLFGGGGGLFGGGSGGGGFLRGAMQAAAGVAAGEIAFRGMEDLFHGFGGQERGFSGGVGGGETVVNNYYDDDRGDSGRDRDTGGRDAADRDDKGFYNAGNDASRSDSDDTGDNGQNDFSSGNDTFADSGSDDLTSDDSSSDLGGFDDNSGGDSSDNNS